MKETRSFELGISDQPDCCVQCGIRPDIFEFTRKAFGVWKVKYFFAKCPICGETGGMSVDAEFAVKAWNEKQDVKRRSVT